MSWSHDFTQKNTQTRARFQHVLQRAGGETVATELGSVQKESSKVEEKTVIRKKQAPSKKLARTRRRGEIHVTDFGR